MAKGQPLARNASTAASCSADPRGGRTSGVGFGGFGGARRYRRTSRSAPAGCGRLIRLAADKEGDIEPVLAIGRRQRLGLARDYPKPVVTSASGRKRSSRGVRLQANSPGMPDSEPRARRSTSLRLVEHLVMQPQEPTAEVEADRPHGRQLEARHLLEQRRLDQFLETFDLQTDRRLRPAEIFRRTGEAARLHDRDKGPDDVDRDAAGGQLSEFSEAAIGCAHTPFATVP